MKAHVSSILLGVEDLERSRQFYVDGLGWTPDLEVEGDVIMIVAGERLVFSLWDREHFQAEVGQIAMTDDANPLALQQGLGDIWIDRDPTNRFDLGTGDRLTIGNQRQRLEQRARISLWALGPQSRDCWRVLAPDLHTKTGAGLLDLHRTRLELALQCVEHRPDAIGRGAI